MNPTCFCCRLDEMDQDWLKLVWATYNAHLARVGTATVEIRGTRPAPKAEAHPPRIFAVVRQQIPGRP